MAITGPFSLFTPVNSGSASGVTSASVTPVAGSLVLIEVSARANGTIPVNITIANTHAGTWAWTRLIAIDQGTTNASTGSAIFAAVVPTAPGPGTFAVTNTVGLSTRWRMQGWYWSGQASGLPTNFNSNVEVPISTAAVVLPSLPGAGSQVFGFCLANVIQPAIAPVTGFTELAESGDSTAASMQTQYTASPTGTSVGWTITGGTYALMMAVEIAPLVTLTPVTQTLDLRRAINTPVTLALELRRQILTAIAAKTLELRRAIRSPVAKTLELRRQVLTAIAPKTLDLRRAIRSPVSRTLELRRLILAPVLRTLDLRRVVNARVVRTLDLRRAIQVLGTVTRALELRRQILQPVTKTLDLRRAIRSPVATTLELRRLILTTLAATLELRRAIQKPVLRTLDLRRTILTTVLQTLDLRRQINARVTATLELQRENPGYMRPIPNQGGGRALKAKIKKPEEEEGLPPILHHPPPREPLPAPPRPIVISIEELRTIDDRYTPAALRAQLRAVEQANIRAILSTRGRPSPAPADSPLSAMIRALKPRARK